MKLPEGFELPPEQQEARRKAIRLEWITLAYLTSAVVAIYFTLGNSQAMKAAWIEDLLSLIPPIAFLVADRFKSRPPSERFPWGRHRAVSISYAVSALALLLVGSYLFFDSALKLVKAEHPPIGVVEVFDGQVWLGWLMMAALIWSAVPAVILGRVKLPLARTLHDKVLHADAEMNKADWLTAVAALVGVIGIGFGLWFTDAIAGLVISLDIMRDGARYTRFASQDAQDSKPRSYDEQKVHPLVERMREEVVALPWVREAVVRMREEGHVFAAEVIVVPVDEDDLLERVERAVEHLRDIDWKVKDVVVCPVREIDPGETDLEVLGA